jgi:outer membrane immunogenic protein
MQKYARSLILGAAFTVATAGAGFAADLPMKAPVYAPAPVVVYSWAGFYVGFNVGYGWGEIDDRVNPLPSPAAFGASAFTVRPSPDGFLGGVQFGYNWQSGSFVYGVEADFQGTGIKDTRVRTPLTTAAGVPVPGWNSRVTTELDWFGTIRGRLGFTPIPELLVYGTGGFAYGDVKVSSLTTFTPAPPFTYRGSRSDTGTGWTVGGGLEYGFGQWSAKVEYLYVSLDAPSHTALPLAANPPFRLRHNVGDFDLNIVRFGLNYRF